MMETVTLHIKNMVCARCIRVVREELKKTGLNVMAIGLGVATVSAESELLDMGLIGKVLYASGFELVKDKWKEMTKQIKIMIINILYYKDPPNLYTNYSDFIAE